MHRSRTDMEPLKQVDCEEVSIDNVFDADRFQIVSPPKTVSFAHVVEVREYAVTIGDHPLCMDGLPLTLDWEHAEESFVLDIDECSQERRSRYALPRRMSYNERRERLFRVRDHTPTQVKNDEIGMVIQLLENSWAQPNILPAIEMEDIEEETEADLSALEDDEEKPAPNEFCWRRNFRRQQAFSD